MPVPLGLTHSTPLAGTSSPGAMSIGGADGISPAIIPPPPPPPPRLPRRERRRRPPPPPGPRPGPRPGAGVVQLRIVRIRHVAVGLSDVAGDGHVAARTASTASAPASLTRMRIVWCHSHSRTWILLIFRLPWRLPWEPANLGGES